MATQPAIYDRIGIAYRERRRPDPRIARTIAAALEDAETVVNVGAGTGSYEPARTTVAVDISRVMLDQRAAGAAMAVQADATALPFHDGAFAASLAVLTVHHWPDLEEGLAEMTRVARERVVLLTRDPDDDSFWLTRDYFPEIAAIDRGIFPTMERLRRALGRVAIHPLVVPHDCRDGFLGAYWRRPEAYLKAEIRAGMSTFGKIGDPDPGLASLRDDLASGAWRERNGRLMSLAELDLGYRLVVADGAGA